MIAGTVGAMAEGDAQRYAEIASPAAFTVAMLSVFAWLLRNSGCHMRKGRGSAPTALHRQADRHRDRCVGGDR
jgi:hypothetical protein